MDRPRRSYGAIPLVADPSVDCEVMCRPGAPGCFGYRLYGVSLAADFAVRDIDR
jgi:hypothetical protein